MQTIKNDAALVVQMIAGFLGGIMILGLIPGDRVDVNTVGALVIAALCGLAYYGARAYRKSHSA